MTFIYAINKRSVQDLPNRVRNIHSPGYSGMTANDGLANAVIDKMFNANRNANSLIKQIGDDVVMLTGMDPAEADRMLADVVSQVRLAAFYSKGFSMSKPSGLTYRGGNAADRRRFIRKARAASLISSPKIRSGKPIFSKSSTSGIPYYKQESKA